MRHKDIYKIKNKQIINGNFVIKLQTLTLNNEIVRFVDFITSGLNNVEWLIRWKVSVFDSSCQER